MTLIFNLFVLDAAQCSQFPSEAQGLCYPLKAGYELQRLRKSFNNHGMNSYDDQEGP